MMCAVFELNHETLAADPTFAEMARELDKFLPIDSNKSFNRYCREAIQAWAGVSAIISAKLRLNMAIF